MPRSLSPPLLVFPLPLFPSIPGKLTRTDGPPVGGAAVGMGRDGDLFRGLAESDAAGHVRIPYWAPWGTIALLHPDFAPSFTLPRMELAPGTPVRGKVVDEHGKPVANATVF